MSIKLKAVEIEGFRAYNEEQKFNFECASGKIANLVVIYAPNGFGKTSFFDALEWSITGKINRISKNSNVRNIAEEEQGNILKNTDSLNNYGTVKIIGEGDNILETQTKVVGEHNRKTDYREGNLIKITSEFKRLQQSDFCSTNLLAHDKIDSFLRFSNPKERYETLSNFWDVNSDTKTYKTILDIYKESIKKEQEVSLQILKLKEELASISFSPEKVKHLISLIKVFNSKYQMSLDETLQADTKKNLDKCIDYKTQIIKLNTNLKDKLGDITYLRQELPNYIGDISKLSSLKEKTKEILGLLNKYDELERKRKTVKVLEDEGNVYKIQLEKYNKLNDNWNDFMQINDFIKKINSDNLLITEGITQISVSNAQFKIDSFKGETKIKELEEQQKRYFQLCEEINFKYNKYESIKAREHRQRRSFDTLSEIVKLRIVRIDNLKLEINKLSSFIKLDNDLILNQECKFPEFKSKYVICQDIFNESQNKKKLLKDKEKEYLEFGKLNDQINNVIKSGKALIQQTLTSKCPLCNNEYQSFENLLENVDKSFGDVVNLNKIASEITNAKDFLEDKEKQLNGALIEFRKTIENYIRLLSNKIDKEQIKVFKDESIILKNKNILDEDSINYIEIKRYFMDINKDVDISSGINDIRKELLIINDKQKLLIEEEKQKEAKILLNLKSNQERIVNQKGIIDIATARIGELIRNPIYVDVTNSLLQLGLNKNEVKLKAKLEELELTITNQNSEILRLKGAILNLELELNSYKSEQLSKDFVTYKDKSISVGSKIISFESRYKKYFVETERQNISINTLDGLYSQIEKQTKLNESILNNLIEITEHLNYLNNNKEWIAKTTKITELTEKLKIITVAKTELGEAKNTSINYIIDRINKYFNLNIINQIYTKIDPHPNLTHIKFEPKFTEDLPELSIHAYSNDSKRGIAPVLYMSSAQINILSLSIFLARSLESKDNILNTIFMDDPIQHLDGINILSFIDLLRTVITEMDRQIIVSTHNESFYRLIKKKIDPEYFNAKYLELETYGILKTE